MNDDFLAELHNVIEETYEKTIGHFGREGGSHLAPTWVLKGAANELERLRTERRWIPVTERLPEKDVPVLTFGRHGIVIGAYGREYGGVAGWDAVDSDSESGEPWLRESGTPTHWMPLPAPPTP